MKKSELKEMIKAAYLSEADFTNAQDDDAALGGMYDPVYEAEEEDLDEMLARLSEEEVEEGEDKVVDPYMAEDLSEQEEEEEGDVDVDTEEETADGGEEKTANDSIVVDKKIVSLSSLPQDTRKILDTLETLRAQAEEFGDQKFITQVGNTITFFTRDFVVAGDEPTRAKVDESLEILKMKKLAGLLTEGEYAKVLLRENEEMKIFDLKDQNDNPTELFKIENFTTVEEAIAALEAYLDEEGLYTKSTGVGYNYAYVASDGNVAFVKSLGEFSDGYQTEEEWGVASSKPIN
jgi:hypothetical protein